jgi:mRNA-degrading endonuclease RelE of RelBE toxin-antitoxin system
MTVKVLETPAYTQRSEDLLTADEREGVRSFLAEYPEGGDVIQGLTGLRKLRWTQQSRNKGKRGGTRVIYFYALSQHVIVLLYVYSKDEKEDLTNADRKQLKKAVAELKAEIARSEGEDNEARKRTGKGTSAGRGPLPR